MRRCASLPTERNMGVKRTETSIKCATACYLSLCNVRPMPPTLNQRVQGSSPCAPTNKINSCTALTIGTGLGNALYKNREQ